MEKQNDSHVAAMGPAQTEHSSLRNNRRSATGDSNHDTIPVPNKTTTTTPRASAVDPADIDHIPALDATTEITYRYLTFATPLPPANTIRTTPNSTRPPPPLPNLAPYTDPTRWPSSRKNLLLALSCIATFLTAYTAGAYSPPQHLLQTSLSISSTIPVLSGITTFCIGFAFAPMVLAPFSEMNGRYPVFVVSGTLFVASQAACGFAVHSLAGLLTARLFVGVGGSVFSTMVGGVIADMWDAEGRNTPMALFSGSVLMGTALGPLVAAAMTERLREGEGWRWIFWHQVVMGGVLMVALVVLFRESRGSVLLGRKARVVNRWYEERERVGFFGVWVTEEGEGEDGEDGSGSGSGMDEEKGVCEGRDIAGSPSSPTATLRRIRWLVKDDEERPSVGKMISISLTRPFHLLCTEPVVFFFSLWVAFAWGVLYLTFGSIPLVFRRQYGWGIEKAGRVFIAMMVGAVLATAVGIWQERILHHPQWVAAPIRTSGSSSSSSASSTTLPASKTWSFIRRTFPSNAPESRLYFTCITSTLLPLGLFIFGFTARPTIHWLAPATGIVLATMGILSIYLAVFNYLADTYHKYASSALAAQSFCRNILGGVFPLVTGLLFERLGERGAAGLLGGIAALLTAVPWVLVFYGERIRGRSPFASQLEKT
ncbi:major facilitator superfamily domain-containing protein [Cercophora scortea]|uniref:Major facilitator superfamily domain-containing protein n=1 Tax=Cercophora scortea TaxID=314031 RepID=A0AAE0M3B1_9PEZI|nr:major facilitator superfamily domain-containing protein [Cercophora scortea]